MRILLINTNRMQPPIAPVALDYLATTLRRAGHTVDLLDLCFTPAPEEAIDRQLRLVEYEGIGLTFRNTEDCFYPGHSWHLPELVASVGAIRARSAAPIILGGAGFSVLPQAILQATGVDFGVAGEGEFVLEAWARGERTVPGLIARQGDRRELPAPQAGPLADLPAMRRDFVDNQRYYREGGQIGFETKRGCAAACIYCADPVAKGRSVRVRPPAAVADELEALVGQGIVHLHTCDAEFNRPLDHALAVCEAVKCRGLGRRLRWYAYCTPAPFPDQLARAMRQTGCVGINFGADSGDDTMLRRLGRDFTADDLLDAARRCRKHGLATMFDLLLGGPGETGTTIRRSLEVVRRAAPDRVGVSVGVRVYPGTALARQVAGQRDALHGPGAGDGDWVRPAFYLAPELGEGLFALIRSVVGEDRRFFFADPTDPNRNYNYDANAVLIEALRRGYRGAYWDVLRRVQEGLPADG